jgi:hypothetical protein
MPVSHPKPFYQEIKRRYPQKRITKASSNCQGKIENKKGIQKN